MMARRVACSACWSVNLNRGGGWTYVDRVKPLELHDFFVQSEGPFISKHARFIVCRSCCGGLIRARCEREKDL